MTRGVVASISIIMSLVRKKSAPARSILLTKQMRGTLYRSACEHATLQWAVCTGFKGSGGAWDADTADGTRIHLGPVKTTIQPAARKHDEPVIQGRWKSSGTSHQQIRVIRQLARLPQQDIPVARQSRSEAQLPPLHRRARCSHPEHAEHAQPVHVRHQVAFLIMKECRASPDAKQITMLGHSPVKESEHERGVY